MNGQIAWPMVIRNGCHHCHSSISSSLTRWGLCFLWIDDYYNDDDDDDANKSICWTRMNLWIWQLINWSIFCCCFIRYRISSNLLVIRLAHIWHTWDNLLLILLFCYSILLGYLISTCLSSSIWSVSQSVSQSIVYWHEGNCNFHSVIIIVVVVVGRWKKKI